MRAPGAEAEPGLRARSRLFGLLGHLLLDGFDADALATAQALPALARALPDLDADRLAARHHRAFSLGVPPYDSVLVGVEGQLGGDRAAAARALLEASGLRTLRSDVEPDHLGMLLRGVGFLCAAEADAVRDGVPADAIRALQARLLDEHLLPAWPPFAVAVSRLDLAEWTAVVELAGALLAASRAALPGPSTPQLPEVAQVELLDDPKTGLKRIARWLLVPSWAGLWLSRADLDALAHAADVPRGFGERVQMLESLLFSAVDHQRVDLVLDALIAVVDAWDGAYARLADEGVPVAAWRTRLEGTREVARRMRAAVGGISAA